MIEVSDLSKVFVPRKGAPITALDGVSLTIERNEFVAVVGPSGCGKSTLLRIIAGLIAPTGGDVSINGERVTKPLAEVGIVFQHPTLLPWATILDNVLFPLRMTNRMQSDSSQRASELLELVGLCGFERRYPRELSGGMQQRVSICRALIGDPDLLLMDEPFGALDALTREEMTEQLLRVWTERPKGILFITHSIAEAVLLADRVVVMTPRPGRIAEIMSVNLPRPRTFDHEATDEFHRCSQRIRSIVFGKRRAS